MIPSYTSTLGTLLRFLLACCITLSSSLSNIPRGVAQSDTCEPYSAPACDYGDQSPSGQKEPDKGGAPGVTDGEGSKDVDGKREKAPEDAEDPKADYSTGSPPQPPVPEGSGQGSPSEPKKAPPGAPPLPASASAKRRDPRPQGTDPVKGAQEYIQRKKAQLEKLANTGDSSAKDALQRLNELETETQANLKKLEELNAEAATTQNVEQQEKLANESADTLKKLDKLAREAGNLLDGLDTANDVKNARDSIAARIKELEHLRDADIELGLSDAAKAEKNREIEALREAQYQIDVALNEGDRDKVINTFKKTGLTRRGTIPSKTRQDIQSSEEYKRKRARLKAAQDKINSFSSFLGFLFTLQSTVDAAFKELTAAQLDLKAFIQEQDISEKDRAALQHSQTAEDSIKNAEFSGQMDTVQDTATVAAMQPILLERIALTGASAWITYHAARTKNPIAIAIAAGTLAYNASMDAQIAEAGLTGSDGFDELELGKQYLDPETRQKMQEKAKKAAFRAAALTYLTLRGIQSAGVKEGLTQIAKMLGIGGILGAGLPELVTQLSAAVDAACDMLLRGKSLTEALDHLQNTLEEAYPSVSETADRMVGNFTNGALDTPLDIVTFRGAGKLLKTVGGKVKLIRKIGDILSTKGLQASIAGHSLADSKKEYDAFKKALGELEAAVDRGASDDEIAALEKKVTDAWVAFGVALTTAGAAVADMGGGKPSGPSSNETSKNTTEPKTGNDSLSPSDQKTGNDSKHLSNDTSPGDKSNNSTGQNNDNSSTPPKTTQEAKAAIDEQIRQLNQGREKPELSESEKAKIDEEIRRLEEERKKLDPTKPEASIPETLAQVRERITTSDPTGPGKDITVYHETSPENVKSITDNGFTSQHAVDLVDPKTGQPTSRVPIWFSPTGPKTAGPGKLKVTLKGQKIYDATASNEPLTPQRIQELIDQGYTGVMDRSYSAFANKIEGEPYEIIIFKEPNTPLKGEPLTELVEDSELLQKTGGNGVPNGDRDLRKLTPQQEAAIAEKVKRSAERIKEQHPDADMDEVVANLKEKAIKELTGKLQQSVATALRETVPEISSADMRSALRSGKTPAEVIDLAMPGLRQSNPDAFDARVSEFVNRLDKKQSEFVDVWAKGELHLNGPPKSYPQNERDENGLWPVTPKYNPLYDSPAKTVEKEISEGIYDPQSGYRKNPSAKKLGSEIALDASGRLSDLQTGQILKDGKYIFAVDKNGTMIIGTRTSRAYPHPTLIGGLDPRVRTAGEITIKDGIITEIDNQTGHFRVGEGSLKEAKRSLVEAWHSDNPGGTASPYDNVPLSAWKK